MSNGLQLIIKLAMSLMALTESALPNSSFFTTRTTNFTVPWLALTCGLNAIVTILISGRIIYYARMTLANEKSSGKRSFHTSIVAILVESALPFTVLGILCAIYFGKQQAPELAFAFVWGAFVVSKVLNEKFSDSTRLNLIFTAYFTTVDHITSCYGPRMDKGNSHKTWPGVVKHAICRGSTSRDRRRIVHLRKIWIKEYLFR